MTSNNIDITPTIQPDEIHALVAPGLPSPVSLTSLLEKILTQITDHGIEPLKNPIEIHTMVSYISSAAALLEADKITFMKTITKQQTQ